MEEKSIMETNNISVDTFRHASSSQRENANTIFTSEKLDKLDKLVDTIKNMRINNAIYYESDTPTTSNIQGNHTRNLKTVTHTRKGIFEKKKLSYQTILILPHTKNPGIDQVIAVIRLAPYTLVTLVTKEIIAGAASDGVWTSRTPWRVSRTDIDKITSDKI